jgi:hypothetical protein
VTKVKLRCRALPSELHIGERSRGDEDPILELLEGVGINPAPYLIRRPIRGFRASPRRSPNRATGPRRGARAQSPGRFPGAPAYAPPVGGPPASMSPAALMSGPLAGARGPPPMGPGGPFPPPGFGPMPPWGTLYHPPGSFAPAPSTYPLLSLGPRPAAIPPPPPSASASRVVDPSLAELWSAVERLQSETREIRSGGLGSRTDLSAYAVGHARKLHSSISARDSPKLHSQISMGLEIALAPRAHKSLLALKLLCSTDVKDIDMKFSWIGDGIFALTFEYCEAEGEELTPEQVRSIERKVISSHRQERAKAVALVAKYSHLYGKNK